MCKLFYFYIKFYDFKKHNSTRLTLKILELVNALVKT